MEQIPYQIFIIYAREDANALKEFRTQLASVVERDSLHIWYDGEILPGKEWDKAIKLNLDKADLILLFISKHFSPLRYARK